MTGSEVRKVLQENRINFAWLAKELGISPQGLNSRLLAKEFRQSYLLELNQVLGQPLFEVPTAINEYRLPVYQIQISAGYGMPLDEGKESVTEYVQIPNLKGCIGQSVKSNRPIFNYLKIMRRHADNAMRMIFDNLNGQI